MEQPYLGEIRLFASPAVPQGWAPCDGRSLPITEYPALAHLLNGAFGATDTTFNIPDLRGRTAIGAQNSATPIGASGGQERVSLADKFYSHSHQLFAVGSEGIDASPEGHMLAAMPAADKKPYSPNKPEKTTPGSLHQASVSNAGGSAEHDNMQPSLVINFCIALTGTVPQADGRE
ncbi:tail fiber protein [Desulfovibrio aminophilus]|uniref:phage tail protein n=1 Tax=Desulfovibrio aminophilus TaxID=81425 RepID=UPI003399A2EF